MGADMSTILTTAESQRLAAALECLDHYGHPDVAIKTLCGEGRTPSPELVRRALCGERDLQPAEQAAILNLAAVLDEMALVLQKVAANATVEEQAGVGGL